VLSKEWNELRTGEGYSNDGEYRNQKDMGDPIGEITLEDGTKIDAGGVTVRGCGIAGCVASSRVRMSTARPRPNPTLISTRTAARACASR
jgi:hypothetical protein